MTAADHPVLPPQTRALCLVGPTAVGKTEVALLLAERLGAEIISVDSMQVYRGMDIGTAKPAAAERARVPHHLLDMVDLTQPFSVADFLRLSREALAQIQTRRHLPLFCGGTGLYFKALIHGLGETPPSNSRLRAELETAPIADLLAELARRDPVTFARIDQKNPRRILRALEVIRLTGKPYSAQRAGWTLLAHDPQSPLLILGLSRSPADLRRRIDQRVEDMFHRGLLAETSDLLTRGLAENKTALQALGYRQVAEHLRGLRSLPETVELVKIRTRQFAKRQMTWFRNQLRVRWLHLDAADSPPDTAAKLAREFTNGP
ncbi:MAG TPA: tRNA (adenosine(37)-N6)-dimethylallyltransferase MiaA [Verrucomicrobiae bacterium]